MASSRDHPDIAAVANYSANHSMLCGCSSSSLTVSDIDQHHAPGKEDRQKISREGKLSRDPVRPFVRLVVLLIKIEERHSLGLLT